MFKRTHTHDLREYIYFNYGFLKKCVRAIYIGHIIELYT